MNPIEWLNAHAPGFADLQEQERAAIMHFSLLWSLFEDRVLDNGASSNRIAAKVQEWSNNGRLDASDFIETLAYIRQRYVANGTLTNHFGHLHLRDNDQPQLVEAVLRGNGQPDADAVTAILIIVYRFRNNLLHGQKWTYGINGQLDNFTHANTVLMKALEIEGL